MLSNLKIENVAVIEKAAIDFENGLNILTGETGAGKSIVIDSINAVLGERTTKELVRTGAQSAKVTAFFELINENTASVLRELDIEPEDDGSLLVSRTITADGRSSCRINGQPATASMLKRLGAELITICGQHDSQKLLQKENHLKYVDFLSGIENELQKYSELYHKMQSAKRSLDEIRKNDGDKQQRMEFLKYQIDELENADIQIGEKEELDKEKEKSETKKKLPQIFIRPITLSAETRIRRDFRIRCIISAVFWLS